MSERHNQRGSPTKFRQAVSSAIDREAIVELVYAGRGVPLWGNVSPSNKLWVDQSLPHPARSVEHARELLKAAGFSWRNDGKLSTGRAVPWNFQSLPVLPTVNVPRWPPSSRTI